MSSSRKSRHPRSKLTSRNRDRTKPVPFYLENKIDPISLKHSVKSGSVIPISLLASRIESLKNDIQLYIVKIISTQGSMCKVRISYSHRSKKRVTLIAFINLNHREISFSGKTPL